MNRIEINTDDQYLDLFDVPTTLTFDEPEEDYYDCRVSEDEDEDMRLWSITIKGRYTYRYTHTFPQRYKFQFRLQRGEINGFLKIPLIDDKTLKIDIRAKDSSKVRIGKKGYLPNWDGVRIETSGVYTTDMDAVQRYKRGLKIALHMKQIVDVWIAKMITADMSKHEEYISEKE